MKKELKMIGVGAVAAAGLASAALAQQGDTQTRPTTHQQHQQMMSGGMQNGQRMGTMGDPEMHKQMMAMMENCNRMMERMGNMDMKPRS